MIAEMRPGESARGEAIYRRCRSARAYEDKQGGWTLVTRDGVHLRLQNPASLIVWDLLAGDGATLPQMVAALASRFGSLEDLTLRCDVRRFLRQLEELGFVERLKA
jgi:hypothetical protein